MLLADPVRRVPEAPGALRPEAVESEPASHNRTGFQTEVAICDRPLRRRGAIAVPRAAPSPTKRCADKGLDGRGSAHEPQPASQPPQPDR